MVLDPMVMSAKEAIGSMGDDSPLAVLSDQWRPLSHFFKQNFAQVTNPPIDPLREASSMSLKTRFKNLGNILIESKSQTNVFVLESPFLSTLMLNRMLAFDQVGKVVHLDVSYPLSHEQSNGEGLQQRLTDLRSEAETAVDEGAAMIVLSDENLGPDRLFVPMILAISAVHNHLLQGGGAPLSP